MRVRLFATALRTAGGVLAVVAASSTAAAQLPAEATSGARVPPERLRFQRTLTPGGAGPNRVAVDVALLAASARPTVRLVPDGSGQNWMAVGGLGDIRIFDRGAREVPYLLIAPPAAVPTWQGGNVLPVASTDSTSGFEIDLGVATESDRLRLNGIPAPFLKRVRLEGSGDRTRWTLLVADGTLFDLPNEALRSTELDYARGEYRYLRVTWDDRASGVVPRPSSVSVRVATSTVASTPLREEIRFEVRPSEPGTSRFRLRLPGARLPIVALELTVAGGNLMRAAQVTEPRLSDGQAIAPAVLGRANLRRTVRDGLTADALRIPIAPPTEATIDLVVDDGDNPPLELTRVSAVFAALPFLYFESDGTTQLTAHFGAPDVVAPRYDLEAMRDRVMTLVLADARWGPVRDDGPTLAERPPPAVIGAPGAPINASEFRYSRQINASDAGLTTLALDTAVLAHSALTDLRIAGAQGQQVPYLLEKMDEPYTINLAALVPLSRDSVPPGIRSTGGSRSYYRLHLPTAGLPPSRVVLKTNARVFERRVVLSIAHEPTERRRERWAEPLATAAWRHVDLETPAPALMLSIPTVGATDLMVVVDEGDNSALPLDPPSLLLPSYRLRFFRDADASMTLLYGHPRVTAPRYDIALLAPRLLGSPATEVGMAPEQSATRAAPSTFPGWMFWIVLGAAVIVMLLLIARLVKQTDSSAPPPAPAAAGSIVD